MSHYNKWHGGYFYGTWKPKSKEGDKKSSSSTDSDWSRWAGSGGKTTYYDYTDDEVDYETAYRSRYTSSIGYSGIGGSLYSSYGGYSSRYSSFSYGSTISGDRFKDLSELIVKATREARDLIVILDFPFNIKMNFTGCSSSSFLPDNVREIFIPTDYIDNKDLSNEEKIRTFCSLACNEAAHLKYTEYRIFESFKTSLKTRGYKDRDIPMIESLFNIIEDERVEDLLLKERPGYLEFIEKEKLYEYNKFIKATEAIPDTKAGQFLLNLFKLIRFPKNVDMDVISEFNDLYESIGTIISPLPDSTKETCNISIKVFTEIIKYISSDRFSFPKVEGKSELDQIYELLSAVATAAKSGYEAVCGGFDSGSSIGSSPSTVIAKSKIHPSLKDRATGLAIGGMCDGTIYLGSSKDTFFSIAKDNKEKYEEDKREIASYIPIIRKMIHGYDKNFEFNIFGCRSGLLDTTKLAEAYQGVPQVYVRKGTVQTNKLAVCVLIDESGSMSWGRKMTNARRAAILLNEALKNQPGVELYIYGHSADILYSGATEINIYREGKKAMNQFSLGSATARSENRDGTAIYEVANRVRKLTTNHILMFVVSDGYPAADGYGGYSAMADVKQNVEKVEKMDTDVVQISIDYIEHAGRMFKNFIDISGDVGNMAKNLSNIIKKLIIKNKKTTITQ